MRGLFDSTRLRVQFYVVSALVAGPDVRLSGGRQRGPGGGANPATTNNADRAAEPTRLRFELKLEKGLGCLGCQAVSL